MAKQLLRLPAVCERVGFGRSQLYTLIKQAKFPAPVRLGVRAVAWDSDLIERWIQQRIDKPWVPQRVAA
jgi:prophage regulatory protein